MRKTLTLIRISRIFFNIGATSRFDMILIRKLMVFFFNWNCWTKRACCVFLPTSSAVFWRFVALFVRSEVGLTIRCTNGLKVNRQATAIINTSIYEWCIRLKCYKMRAYPKLKIKFFCKEQFRKQFLKKLFDLNRYPRVS